MTKLRGMPGASGREHQSNIYFFFKGLLTYQLFKFECRRENIWDLMHVGKHSGQKLKVPPAALEGLSVDEEIAGDPRGHGQRILQECSFLL